MSVSDDVEEQRYQERASEIRAAFIEVLQEFTPCDPDNLTDEEIDDLSISEDIGIHDVDDISKLVLMMEERGVSVSTEQIQELDKIKYMIPEIIRG